MDVVALLPNDDVASVPRVFPRAAPPIVSAPANRILLPPLDGRGTKRQFLEIPTYERAEVLHSHCIADAALRANTHAPHLRPSGSERRIISTAKLPRNAASQTSARIASVSVALGAMSKLGWLCHSPM